MIKMLSKMSSPKYANLPVMAQEENKPGMVGVRVEGELMEKIREEAKREHRSLAGMVRVYILEAIEAREAEKKKKGKV
jgi:Ribbon-helix-helix protein, copG family